MGVFHPASTLRNIHTIGMFGKLIRAALHCLGSQHQVSWMYWIDSPIWSARCPTHEVAKLLPQIPDINSGESPSKIAF
jgi:hypothetical protein